MADDVFFFLDRFYGNISGRSRSGSVSESDSRSASRNRSRANSISNEGFIKVEGMTSLPSNNNIPDDHVAAAPVITISDQQKLPSTKPLTSRRIFRIDDVEEDEEEEDEDDHAVQKLSVGDNKKDV